MKPMTTLVMELIQQKSGVDSNEFNEKLAEIQSLLGVQTGGLAGYTFADYDNGRWERLSSISRLQVMREYIHGEISELLSIESIQ